MRQQSLDLYAMCQGLVKGLHMRNHMYSDVCVMTAQRMPTPDDIWYLAFKGVPECTAQPWGLGLTQCRPRAELGRIRAA